MHVCPAADDDHATAATATATDDGVNLHTLPELQQRAQATRSAKATAFAWEPVKRVLAVAVKKKVITHHLASNDLVELTEYNLPEAVACLQWLGGNIIVGEG